MKTSEQQQQQQQRDGSFGGSYRRTDGTVVALPNSLLVNDKKLVSRAASPLFDDNTNAALLAKRGAGGGKEARWQFFFRKDRTRTKLAKLALLLVALFIVSSSSWNPNLNPKRHSRRSFYGDEEASLNGRAAVKISGPKTALSSMFSSSSSNRKEALERRERLTTREERANERERLDRARYGPANEALRGSREHEETRNFGNGMVNRIDWKAKTNQLGREYKEYRRMVDRENRWDGRSQRYGILSRGNDGGSSNSNP
jgi:hypothetical protein